MSPLTVHASARWIVASGFADELAAHGSASDPLGDTKYVLAPAADARPGASAIATAIAAATAEKRSARK